MSDTSSVFALPERSFTGDNAYYFDCEVVGHRPSYFVCLHKLKRREKGPLPEPHQACCEAIGKRQCQAMHMREKEILEGRSIYFEQRKRFEDMTPDRPMAPIVASKPRTLPYIPKHEMPEAPPPIVKRPEPTKEMGGLDFASLVAELASQKEEVALRPTEKPVEPPKPVATPQLSPKPENPPKAAESLLEMARRLKEARKSVTTEGQK